METPAHLLPHVDELVMEYLLFRGFTKSFQAFNAERKRDRAKAFDVEQLITQLLAHVQTYQIESILDTWKFLSARFFSRLDASYASTIRHLEDSWLRLYLVNAIKTGHREHAADFFKLLAIVLNQHANKLNATISKVDDSVDSWGRWFALPYLQNPENDPYFRPFFTREWLEMFITSFRNFLSLIFRNLPLPKLLAFQISRLEEPALKLRLKVSQSECSRLRLHNVQANERILKLEEAGHQLYSVVRTMVQQTYLEHFAQGLARSGSASPVLVPSSAPLPDSVEVMQTLTDQLKAVRHIFGTEVTGSDRVNSGILLDRLHLTVSPGVRSPVDSDHEEAGTIPALSSSASSTSIRSMSSLNSPIRPDGSPLAKRVAPSGRDAGPTMIEEVKLGAEASDESTPAICVFSPDGKYLVISQTGQPQFEVFELSASGRCRLRARVQTDAGMASISWTPLQRLVVYVLKDGTVNLHDLTSDSRGFIMSFNSEARRPVGISCARDCNIAAVALVGTNSDDMVSNRIQFFSIEDRTIKVGAIVDVVDERIVSMDWNPDGSFLAVMHAGGRVSVLDPANLAPPVLWKVSDDPHVVSMLFSPRHNSLLTVNSADQDIVEWQMTEMSDLQPAKTLEVKAVYPVPNPVSFSANGTRCAQIGEHFLVACASAERDGGDSILDASSSRRSKLLLFKRGHHELAHEPIEVAGTVVAIDWHPETCFLAIVSDRATLAIWDIRPAI